MTHVTTIDRLIDQYNRFGLDILEQNIQSLEEKADVISKDEFIFLVMRIDYYYNKYKTEKIF